MAVLIDASILIEAERGRLDLESHVAQRYEKKFFLSVITASALLHGVPRAVQPEVRTKRSACVEAILERFPLLPVDSVTARAHAQLWATLAVAGQMMGAHHLWLATICLAYGFTMVTANVREFARVPGLAVEDWSRAVSRVQLRRTRVCSEPAPLVLRWGLPARAWLVQVTGNAASPGGGREAVIPPQRACQRASPLSRPSRPPQQPVTPTTRQLDAFVRFARFGWCVWIFFANSARSGSPNH